MLIRKLNKKTNQDSDKDVSVGEKNEAGLKDENASKENSALNDENAPQKSVPATSAPTDAK